MWADGAGSRYQASGHNYIAADWHVIAAGVLQFELQCFSQANLDNNQPASVTWDSGSGDVNTLGKAPRRIIVRLQMVDDRAATQLAGLTVGSAPYNLIVQRSARQFICDVSLSPP